MQSLYEDLTSLNLIRSTLIYVKSSEYQSNRRRRDYKPVSTVERQTRETMIRLVRPLQRPMERILVRYSRVPLNVANVVRLEETKEEFQIREMIMHNAISKYLSCKWVLKGFN
jgi:hypothetical protein